MTQLLLHPQTKSHIEQFINKPTHALLLIGPEGAGKKYLADYLAARLLCLSPEKANASPYIMQTDDANGSIGIEQIRQLISFLRLKTTGQNDIRRIVIVKDIQNTTIEAQNALLKSLEEPPADTVFLLTAVSTNNIKATILSRCQLTHLKPVSLAMALAYYSVQNIAADKIKNNYALSEGNVGLLTALVKNEKDHPLMSAITEAKHFLSSKQFERLSSQPFSHDKEALNLFMGALGRVCHAASQAAARNNSSSLKNWHRHLQIIYHAQESLAANANPKLVLTHLSLAL